MLNWKFPSKVSGHQAAQNAQSEVLWFSPFAIVPVSRIKTFLGMRISYLGGRSLHKTPTICMKWGAREAVEETGGDQVITHL